MRQQHRLDFSVEVGDGHELIMRHEASANQSLAVQVSHRTVVTLTITLNCVPHDLPKSSVAVHRDFGGEARGNLGQRRDQRPGVGVGGMAKDGFGRIEFDDLAVQQDRDALTNGSYGQ